MADLIDRAELIENLNHFAPEHYSALVNMIITKQPAVDAVPVVRCKDCKWYYKHIANHDKCCHRNPDGRWKQNFNVTAADDDFCSHGERRHSDECV